MVPASVVVFMVVVGLSANYILIDMELYVDMWPTESEFMHKVRGSAGVPDGHPCHGEALLRAYPHPDDLARALDDGTSLCAYDDLPDITRDIVDHIRENGYIRDREPYEPPPPATD